MINATSDNANAIRAVQYNNFEILKNLLFNNLVHSNAFDKDGCTLLHWAAINNRYEISQFLLDHGADVNITGGVLEETPLHWAVRKEAYNIVLLLLANGADTNVKSARGLDCIHLACQIGASPNSVNDDGDTPLLWILKNKAEAHDIIRLLLRFGADLLLPDKQYQNTPLHMCCLSNFEIDLYISNLIYQAGGKALLLVKNKEGLTPYRLAIKYRNGEMARFFFDIFLYDRLPKHFPTIMSALFVPLLFYLLHALHTFYGTLLWVALGILVEKCIQPSIIIANSRSNQGAAWGVVTTIIVTFIVCIKPHVTSNCWYVFGTLASSVVFLKAYVAVKKPMTLRKSEDGNIIISKIITHKAILSNRGQPTRPPLSPAINLVAGNSSGAAAAGMDASSEHFRLCTTCVTDKNLTANHCPNCNVCVVDFDHHCPYIDNCIGKGNRRLFVLFSAVTSVACAVFFFSAMWVQSNDMCPTSGSTSITNMFWVFFSFEYCVFTTHPPFALATLLGGLTAIWTGSVAFCQCMFVAFETSTYQYKVSPLRGHLHPAFTGNPPSTSGPLLPPHSVTMMRAEESLGLLQDSGTGSAVTMTSSRVYREGSFDGEGSVSDVEDVDEEGYGTKTAEVRMAAHVSGNTSSRKKPCCSHDSQNFTPASNWAAISAPGKYSIRPEDRV